MPWYGLPTVTGRAVFPRTAGLRFIRRGREYRGHHSSYGQVGPGGPALARTIRFRIRYRWGPLPIGSVPDIEEEIRPAAGYGYHLAGGV